MEQQVWEIDENNVFTGKSYFADIAKGNHVTTPLLIGYIKPLWTGTEWVEGATEEEIQAWKDSQTTDSTQTKTTNEKLAELLAEHKELQTRITATEDVIMSLMAEI